MRPIFRGVALTVGMVIVASLLSAQQTSSRGAYKVLKTVRVGGDGGFDYIAADVEGRRLYVPRSGPMGQVTIYNLDTLEPVGTIPSVKSGGTIVDPKSHHGFSTTKPITMWDSTTLQVIKTIDVDSRPDGIMFDPFNERVWVFSHTAPHATVIDGKEGTVVGTVDLGGEPEQAASDGKGTIYVNISDKENIAVVDAKKLTVTAHYDLSSKQGASGTGLSLDAKNHILFVYYRQPSPMVVIVNATNGKIIDTLTTGQFVDTVAFNPATMEAISADGGGPVGTMTFIKENSPTSFTVEQTLKTMEGARTMTLDTKTGHLFTVTGDWAPPAPNAPPGPGGRPPRGPMISGSFTILMIGKQ
jgi:hypothetical protein